MDPFSTTPGRQTHRSQAPQRAVASRDAGLELVRRTNRWLIAGAVAATGFVSLAAAHAFHGRTITGSGASSSASSPTQQSGSLSSASSPTQQSGSSSRAGGGGLQSPSQTPVSGSSGSTGVVSGGS